MSFLKKFFGSSDPFAPLQKAVAQKRWADALALAEDLMPKARELNRTADLEHLAKVASDGLAALNLSEGEACHRAGDDPKAQEHFALARSQARSEELIQKIERAMSLSSQSEEVASRRHIHVSTHGSCSGSCGSTSSGVTEDISTAEDLDWEARLELILGSYPEDLADLCRQKSDLFIEAFLLAHEGEQKASLEKFASVDTAERDVLYFLERGSVLGRLGAYKEAVRDLEQALELNPGLELAWVTLVNLDLAHHFPDQAEKRISVLMQQGRLVGFCMAKKTQISLGRNDADSALKYGLEALGLGVVDGNLCVFCASMLESQGQLKEAESVLSMIPGGGGCSGGGINPYLAEFYLRHNLHAEKSMEAFKSALRSDAENSRWFLRIGQAYLLKGWKKEGSELVKKALLDPDLSPELAQEARQSLGQ